MNNAAITFVAKRYFEEIDDLLETVFEIIIVFQAVSKSHHK